MEYGKGNTQEEEKKWNKIFVAGTKIQVELFGMFQNHSMFSKRNQATDDPSSREGNLYDSRYILPSSPYDNYMCWINTGGDTF